MNPASSTDTSAIDVPDNRHPLEIGNFRLMWLARLAAVLGSTAQAATIALQIYEIASVSASRNEAALQLGLFGLVQFLAMFALTLPAGIVVDRTDRKLIVVLTLGLSSVLSLVFLGYSYLKDPPIWGLFVLGAGQGALRAFLAPAFTALGPMIVPRSVLPRAIAMSSMSFQVGSIVGPGLAGLLLVSSTHTAYVVCAVLMVASTISVAFIKANTRPEPPTAGRMEMLKEGIRFVRDSKLLLGAMSLDLAAVLLAGVTALLPVFALDILHASTFEYGLLRSAMPAGAIVTSLYLSKFPLRRHAGLWMYASVAAFGAATIVFGVSQSYLLSLLMLVFLGAVDMISVFTRQTLVQIVTPDHMRGRVASVSLLFIGASNELGEFESGVMARFLGPVGSAIFGGVGAIGVTGLWIKLFPDLWKADRLE